VAVIGLLLVVLAAQGVRTLIEQRAAVRDLERMRADVLALRARVESCQVAVERELEAFEQYRSSVDSLRQEVQDFEGLDARGVPVGQYEAYLETFREYNRSVPGWRSRADSLEAHSRECRELTVRHNELADSLRGRVEDDDIGPAPPGGA
jgi:hypothetical protein